DVEPGEKVLVDDGKIVLEVLETNKKDNVKLKVLFGSVISSNKGVNLPDTKVSLPCLTEKDLADLDFILTQPVNWIALSFVRSADDIIDLRKRVEARHHEAKILAKIEKPEAVRRIKKIIKASNAIMIARGDLAVELPMEKLPGIQKEIINLCMQWARPVIVATQMMESMIHNPSPTRAEITDVANAVLDGADALMLSAETAVGDHPPKVIEAMNKIIIEAEKTFSVKGRRPTPNSKSRTFLSDVICFNAAKTAVDVGAQAILGLTISGYTAFKISSYRPDCKIYIFSERSLMLGTMNLLWGVQCFEYKKYTTTDETFEDITNILKTQNLLKHGDLIVQTASMPIDRRLRTNMLKVCHVD
ncbi:MAG TPA: pyruvate kinase, partial [Saprospiraceae bacterium]|nr:pyruvate kinase [Saprospiraceae bacterium]